MRQSNKSVLLCKYLIKYRQKAASNAGLSLIEIVVTIALLGLLAAFAAPAIKFGTNPLKDTSERISANIKLARSKAMAQTAAYRIRPLSVNQFIIEHANTCKDATWTTASAFVAEDLALDNPTALVSAMVDGASVSNTDWNICFNSRGTMDKTVKLTIKDVDTNRQRTLETFLGGTVDLSEIS